MFEPSDEYKADPAYQKLEGLFDDFVRQGEGRKIMWLVEKAALPIGVVNRCLSEGQWMRRIYDIKTEAQKQARAKTVGDVSTLNESDASDLTELLDLARDKLLDKIRNGEASPATLLKLYEFAITKRREVLGLDDGGTGGLVDELKKMIEKTAFTEPGRSYKLNKETLALPTDLPESDFLTQDRPLTQEEKRQLRG